MNCGCLYTLLYTLLLCKSIHTPTHAYLYKHLFKLFNYLTSVNTFKHIYSVALPPSSFSLSLSLALSVCEYVYI